MNIFKQVTANNILLESYPFFKELAMEAYIMENESILKLDNDNFSQPEVVDVEIALKKGRRDKDGRIDILARYSDNIFAIAELKIDEVNDDTLKQLESYLTQREQLRDLIFDPESSQDLDFNDIKWVGVVVGRSISKELASKLENGYEFDCNGTKIPIAAITLNRYRAKMTSDIYVVSDTYFKFSSTNKDYSKYIFEGNIYNKGQLVNAVIKSYVSNNPKISYSDLERKIPQKIQGSSGVFRKVDDAKELYDRHNGKYKRHYLDPDKIINLADSKIATSTQWNKENVLAFIDNAKKLGFKIQASK